MNDEQLVGGSIEAQRLTDAPVVEAVAEDRGSLSASSRGMRFDRRSSYCAETAWVWRRAHLICARPE